MVAKDTAPAGGSRPVLKAKAPASAPSRGASTAKASGTAGDRVARRVNAPSLTTFFQESRAELRKVTWPTRQETMNLTAAVMAMTVAIAVFLGFFDAVLDQLIKPIIGAK